ncbi:hypothetical protein GCM10010293_31580 [Streptomyces griseoflavus]|nr:hypothetical protein GCM10010293_31580 [Streptomyces griseoflavus]
MGEEGVGTVSDMRGETFLLADRNCDPAVSTTWCGSREPRVSHVSPGTCGGGRAPVRPPRRYGTVSAVVPSSGARSVSFTGGVSGVLWRSAQ